MKSYLDLVSQYARVHRRKNRITVLCIAIAVCLVTAIFGMADMAIRAEVDRAIREDGNFHIAIKDLDEAAGQMISLRPDVAVSGGLTAASSAALGGRELMLQGSNEALSSEMGLTVSEGRFPQTADEALVDRQVLDALGLSIGDMVTTEAVGGPPVTFTICGTFNDFSSLKSRDQHAAFFNEAGIKQCLENRDSRTVYYLQFKNTLDIRPGIEDIQTTYGLSPGQIQENQRLLGLYGVSGDPYGYALYGIALVLFLLVLTAGTIMISSSFNISILERTQFFGLLRCLGASKKQVRRYVRRESLGFSLRGIPWAACRHGHHLDFLRRGGAFQPGLLRQPASVSAQPHRPGRRCRRRFSDCISGGHVPLQKSLKSLPLKRSYGQYDRQSSQGAPGRKNQPPAGGHRHGDQPRLWEPEEYGSDGRLLCHQHRSLFIFYGVH